MEKIVLKYNTILQAVESLHKAIATLEKKNNYIKIEFILRNQPVPDDEQDIVLGLRDSIIQRFKYSTDSLWKYLQTYIEVVLKITLELGGPKYIIRSCCKNGLLTEQETIQVIEMLDARNLSSHIYKEEIAQQIATAIPNYYALIVHILDKAKPE